MSVTTRTSRWRILLLAGSCVWRIGAESLTLDAQANNYTRGSIL